MLSLIPHQTDSQPHCRPFRVMGVAAVMDYTGDPVWLIEADPVKPEETEPRRVSWTYSRVNLIAPIAVGDIVKVDMIECVDDESLDDEHLEDEW